MQQKTRKGKCRMFWSRVAKKKESYEEERKSEYSESTGTDQDSYIKKEQEDDENEE